MYRPCAMEDGKDNKKRCKTRTAPYALVHWVLLQLNKMTPVFLQGLDLGPAAQATIKSWNYRLVSVAILRRLDYDTNYEHVQWI